MVEALACGTPVLALRNGSVPEVVRDGVTGFVADTEDELVEDVDRLWTIERHACRQDVECRFSPAAMAAAYERVYEDLISQPMIDVSPLARVAADRDASGPRISLDGIDQRLGVGI
jgi:glycosyltransferase involved in cell wall biosynthesis